MTTPRKVRWLIAHQPQDLFVRTAKAFSEALKKHCDDEIEIEILTYDDYIERYNAIPGLEEMVHCPENEEVFNNVGMRAFWDALFDSEIEMSQLQVARVADQNYDFHALDLPFLFNSHDHVQQVVEGPIGQKLCAELGRKSGVTGLAFTYSGGYRVIGSHKPIATLDELKSMTIAVQQPTSLGMTIEDMGGQYKQSPPTLWHQRDPILNDGCDAVETTYLRFEQIHGSHILKTNHSMFMTTILVSNKFWNSLTEKQQDAFRKAALDASRQERQWSIDDAAAFEADAEKNGVTIIDMSAEDTEELKRQAQLTWVKCQRFWQDKDIVKNIVRTGLQ